MLPSARGAPGALGLAFGSNASPRRPACGAPADRPAAPPPAAADRLAAADRAAVAAGSPAVADTTAAAALPAAAATAAAAAGPWPCFRQCRRGQGGGRRGAAALAQLLFELAHAELQLLVLAGQLPQAIFKLLDAQDRFGLGHRRILCKGRRGRHQHRCARHHSCCRKHRCLTGNWRFLKITGTAMTCGAGVRQKCDLRKGRGLHQAKTRETKTAPFRAPSNVMFC